MRARDCGQVALPTQQRVKQTLYKQPGWPFWQVGIELHAAVVLVMAAQREIHQACKVPDTCGSGRLDEVDEHSLVVDDREDERAGLPPDAVILNRLVREAALGA